MTHRFLVTGAAGCLGAWVISRLLDRGEAVIAFDASDDLARWRLLLDDERIATVPFIRGDIGDAAQIERVVEESGISHIVHLAAMQVPGCRTDPVAGARVNVVGTTACFAVAAKLRHVERIVYASSAAVYGPASSYQADTVDESAASLPATHYGVFKQANEATARIFFQEHRVASVGLRPYVIYGLGRDRGMTSAPTKAMLSAVLGNRYLIPFAGTFNFQWAGDAADAFIACATGAPDGALVYNTGTQRADIADVVAGIERVIPGAAHLLAHGEARLPFPRHLSADRLALQFPSLRERPIAEGIASTIAGFRRALEHGRLDVGTALVG
jgi:nucleoside-diphosphate-sugar epimerase